MGADFFSTLGGLALLSEPLIYTAFAVMTRISAIAFFAPGLGERAVPMRIRLSIVFALTIIVTPLVMSSTPQIPANTVELTKLLAAEAVSGLFIGFSIRMMVFVLQIAGSMTAQHLSLSQIFGASVGFDAEPPFTTILVMGGLALLAASGFHFYLVRVIADLYVILPYGDFPGASTVGEWSAALTGKAFMQALALASPFVLLGFIYSLALSAASRAMPQLMAAFVGAPAITMAGLALFATTAGIMLRQWMNLFDSHISTLFGAG